MRPVVLALALLVATPLATALPAEGALCGIFRGPIGDVTQCMPDNAGFERCTGCTGVLGDVPDGWSTASPEAVQWNQDDAHRGDSSVRLSGPGTVTLVSSDIPLRPGLVYDVAVWDRAETPRSTQWVQVSLRFYDEDGELVQPRDPSVAFRTQPFWTRVAFHARAPLPTEFGRLEVSCFDTSLGVCHALVDDALVAPISG